MSGSGSTEWYLQINGERRGPFPAWQVSRYLMLQRLDEHSKASRDGDNWVALAELPELHPERRLGIADLAAAERERLEATAEWVTEHAKLFQYGHVRQEQDEEGEYSHLQPTPSTHTNRLLAYGVVVLLLLAVTAIPFLLPSAPKLADPQCEAIAAPGVNWSNCQMRGSNLPGSDLRGAMLRNVNLSASDLSGAILGEADLSYANLSLSELRGAQMQHTQLKGANLRNTNLSKANLAGADLQYADLTGAVLEGATLEGASLGYAIWEENVTCMPESVGQCLPARSMQ